MTPRGIDAWGVLFMMELKSWRRNWVWSAGLSALYPLSLLWFLRLSGGVHSNVHAAQAIAGSLVFAVVLNATVGLGQELAALRDSGSLDFYATLPLHRASLVTAILARTMVLTLPSVLIVAALGSFWLGTGATPVAVLSIPILLATGLALSSLGALIGFYSPSARAANFITQAAYTLFVFVSPAMLPLESLPPTLRTVAMALPTTYAARALGSLLSPAPELHRVASDVAILGVYAVGSLLLLSRHLAWRRE